MRQSAQIVQLASPLHHARTWRDYMKRNGAYVMALPWLAEDFFALPLKDIAAQSGFGSANSLIRTFEKYEGMTPGEYRRAAC